MRLTVFLSDIERSLIAQSAVANNGAWETHRLVNVHYGLGRLTVTARPGREMRCSGGTIFLQSFVLADGSTCLKVSMNWNGSDSLPVFSIYPSMTLNWRLEASRIAALWLEGPQTGTRAADTESESLPRPNPARE